MTRKETVTVKSGNSTRSKFRARRDLERLIAAGWSVVSEDRREVLGFGWDVYTLERVRADEG